MLSSLGFDFLQVTSLRGMFSVEKISKEKFIFALICSRDWLSELLLISAEPVFKLYFLPPSLPASLQRHEVGAGGGGRGELRHGCRDGGEASPLLTGAGRSETVEVDVGGGQSRPSLHQTVQVEADPTAGRLYTDSLDIGEGESFQ